MDLRVLLFVSIVAVLIFPQYAFSAEPDSNSSDTIMFSSTNSTIVPKPNIVIDSTSSTITSNQGTSNQGSPISFTVRVMDTSNLPTIASGIVTWSDGNIGGIFDPSSCTISSDSCTVSYTPPANYGGLITITSSYGGDTTHSASTGTFTLTVTALHSVITTITSTTGSGSQVQFTATLVDASNSQITPTGSVTWSDGNLGGTFSQSSCILSSGSCTVSYTPIANYGSNILITTNYESDGTFSTSTGTFTLMIHTLPNTTVTVTPSTVTVNRGSQVRFTATVADVSKLSTVQTGSVTWSDGNIGGTFDPSSCTISSGSCTISYTPTTTTSNLVTVTATYATNNEYSGSTGTSILTINSLPDTTTIVTPITATINQGSQIQFTATVADASSSQITPTGSVTWSDGNLGGTFNTPSCTISSGSCTVSYTAPLNYGGTITITTNYGGDTTHSGSTGTSTLALDMLHNTTTTVTPNTVAAAQGSKVQFTATLADTSISSIVTGNVSWSDDNAGGSFDTASCTLSSNACTVFYTPSTSSTNAVTITATYGGDSTHSGSFGTAQSTIITLPPSLLLNTDQSYYAYGDVVTLSVNLPGQSLQSIAVGVSNPSGDNIISRTITTDENGTGYLQFKIPDTYQTGVYQDTVNANVDGRHYANSTEFNVIKSRGVSIDSVQITNQQGNPVSILPQGQNGFVKVSLSSGEKMPALLTLNLFDANQSSLGTTSVKSILNPGTSQMTLSFFIPSNVQVGVANVFTDVYSDWPTNGGTPLTAESCLAADLQNVSTLPASYVPSAPHACTTSTGQVSGAGNILSTAMTNNQAEVTLGVAIQNDSMTFMSPTQAHLLALAYENNTGKNITNNSVGTVNVNLNSLGTNGTSTGTVGNTTGIGPAQFTTLAGPDLQNNPMAMKILQEIQASKKQVANILGNQTAARLDQQLVLQQRQAAASQLKQDLSTLAAASASATPDAAYANFLKTVNDNRTQSVFQDEFNFMKQRIAVANTAMQSVITGGGSLDQALVTFNKYATVNHVQMVSLNNELNVAYGLADSKIQSCFNNAGQLTVVNGVNPCIANVENNSTGPTGISIVSVQPTDQQGNPISLIKRGQTGYVKVIIDSNVSTQSLITVNIFDSNVSSLGTASAQYALSPGQSEVVLPYYVPAQSGTGLASVYANVFTDWPNKGGTSQSNELSYFVGLS
ncbi:MAG: beta strand repeat-containing protein [Nitrosotalea sp.]